MRPKAQAEIYVAGLKEESKLAQRFATAAAEIYGKLADESRKMASLLEQAIGNSLSEAEFSIRLAKSIAEYQDTLAKLMLVAPAVAQVLVDRQPDSSGHMSRLRITAEERADLVWQIDTAFGQRAQGSKDKALPYIDATVSRLREWLTSGYTPRP